MLTPSTRARTMRPGTTPFGLSSTARIATVPVASSTRGETNSIGPWLRATRPARPRCVTPTLPAVVGRKRRAHEVRIGVGDREIDVQTIRLDDVSQQARLAAGGDEAAFGTHLAARQAGDRRANVRVRQLELGRAQRGLRGGHGGLGALERRERRVAIAHARELLRRTAARCGRARAVPDRGWLLRRRAQHALARPRAETDPDRCGTAPRRPRRAHPRRSGARAGCPRRARAPRPRARL